MGVSINAPKTPVTKGSNAIAAATTPNVCKMPGPPAPFVPTPLPNIGKSGDSPKGYSKTVLLEGNTVAIQGASFGSMGDAASKGTGGGLVSMNTHGPTKFIAPGSLDTKIEGKNVQLLGDQMVNNCGPSGSPPNAATMAGDVQNPAQAAIDVEEQCAHCGKPLAGHRPVLATDDKKLVKAANAGPKGTGPLTGGKTVGAMETPAGSTVFSASGGGDGKLFNVHSKKLIPLSDKQKRTLAAMGNELGNCCEQQMLRQVFVDGGAAVPAGGPKMGIAERIKGRPRAKEIEASKHKDPCGTCKKALVAMFCTDPPAGTKVK